MDKPMPCAPILLLGFNRPDLLRGLVAILTKVRPPKIYLAVDGPRPDRPGEAEKCAACAAVLDNPGWPCEVKKLVRETNLGCRLAVSGAIDWFFSQEEEGIILEDDCWPDPSFLRFATELLERYRDDPRIGIISGNNHYGFISDPKASYRFTADISVWGWATWRRAWRVRDCEPMHFIDDGETIIKKTKLTHRGRKLARRFLSQAILDHSSWAIPWTLSLQRHSLLSVAPHANLVANEGWNASGTHTQGFCYDSRLFARTFPMAFPLSHPLRRERDIVADEMHELRSFSFFSRALTAIGAHFALPGRLVCSAARKIEAAFPMLFRL